jgi:hypothetical protein
METGGGLGGADGIGEGIGVEVGSVSSPTGGGAFRTHAESPTTRAHKADKIKNLT